MDAIRPIEAVEFVRPRMGSRSPLVLSRSRRLLAALPDERLVDHLRRGNDIAFEVLYDRHHRGVLSFCRHLLGSATEAEDAVQLSYAAAYDSLRADAREISFKAWLYTIARNRCLSILRSRRDVPAEVDARATASLASEVEGRADLRALLGDLGELPEDQRAALVLTELGDLSHAEVAQVIDCEASKVKSIVFQARAALIDRRRARETPCVEIQEELAGARGGSLRRGHLRRHLALCPACAEFRADVGRQRSMLALALPVVPSVALKESVLGALGIGGAVSGGAIGGTAGGLVGGAAATSAAGAGGASSGVVAAVAAKVGAAKVAAAVIAGTAAVGGGTVAVEQVREEPRAPVVAPQVAPAQAPAEQGRSAAPADAPGRSVSESGGERSGSGASERDGITREPVPSEGRDAAAARDGDGRRLAPSGRRRDATEGTGRRDGAQRGREGAGTRPDRADGARSRRGDRRARRRAESRSAPTDGARFRQGTRRDGARAPGARGERRAAGGGLGTRAPTPSADVVAPAG